MRIDGPKGLGAWLQGWFSGSFRGDLCGTASYADTASYVDAKNVDGLSEHYFNKTVGGIVEGQVILSGSVQYSHRLVVHGSVKILGSFSEGHATLAEGEASHAEGSHTRAMSVGSHAEGLKTVALGASTHAEGVGTRAVGAGSHAEGSGSCTIGIGSHAEGLGTIAEGDYQTVVGTYNKPEPSNKYLFIVGNGTSDRNRSNAFAVKTDGGIEFGDLGSTTSIAFSGSTVKASEFIVRETIEDTVIDRVSLEYNRGEQSLDFKFLSN